MVSVRHGRFNHRTAYPTPLLSSDTQLLDDLFMVRRRNRKFVLTSGLGQWMIVTVGMVLLDCFLAAVLEPTVFASIQWPLRLLELSMIVGVGGIFAGGRGIVAS